MRHYRMLVGTLSVGLSFGAWSAFGQETKSSDAPVAPQAEAKVSDESSLPPIPLQVISRLQGNLAESQKLGLTKPQSEELAAFIAAHYAERSCLQLVLNSLEQAGLKSFRLQSAVTELIEEAAAKAQVKAQTLLTADQRAKLRQAHRLEIQQTAFVSPKPSLNSVGMGTLHQQWENGDLLSVLEIPEIQQTLSLTDEQWQRVEATKKTAYAAARELVLQGREFTTPMFANAWNSPNLQPLIEQFGKDTLSLLSEAQSEKFKGLVQEQQKQFQAAAMRNEIKNPNDYKKFSLVMPHGGITQMQSQANDKGSSFEITLNNAFAHPEVVQQLELTEAQQQEIAKRLTDFHGVLLKKLTEHQQTSQQADAKKRDRLRELVVAHNTESQKQLADLLTAEQQTTLKKVCWKSLGWSALLQPEVAEQLQLTVVQKTAIAAAIKTPAPQVTPFANPSNDFDAFQKYSNEIHRRMSQHHAGIANRVWDSLSPEQRNQFENLTGLRPPKK